MSRYTADSIGIPSLVLLAATAIMWSSLPLSLLALTSTALGAAVPQPPAGEIEVDVPKTDYDAVVVGGGPAGLSALSALARVRRNVLLIDSGDYRNQPTRHMHDVIGFDGADIPIASRVTRVSG